MMRLTKREKILVGVLLCVLAAAFLIMVIIAPQMRIRGENKYLLNMLKEQKQQAEENIAQMPAAKEEILTLEKEANELYDLMSQTKSYDISLILSEMLGRYGLTPVSLEFSDYEMAVPPAAEETAEESEEKADAEGEESDEDENATGESEEETNQYALKRTAVLRFTGVQNQAEAFLDELTNYNISYIISGYTFSEGGNGHLNEIRLDLYEFVKPEEWKASQEENVS